MLELQDLGNGLDIINVHLKRCICYFSPYMLYCMLNDTYILVGFYL